MDVECLDLCISCGSHVADGTAYCSSRCRSIDASPLNAYNRPSSSTHHHAAAYSHPSSSSQSSRRPRLDLQHEAAYYYLPSTSYEVSPSHKLARIEEWAKGVWGHAGDDLPSSSSSRTHRRPSHTTATTPRPSNLSSKPKSTSPASSSRSYNAPRFTLTAQNLAPPAMSIATSEDDLSSVHTPSSSAASSPRPKHEFEGVDPWISSPPYEFAYNHFFAAKKVVSLQDQERGRTLVRV